MLPQILPRLINCLRLQLGPAWLFLIAAEAISSDAGLGYRIFLVRRYLAMDVIFPYVVWITLLAVDHRLSARPAAHRRLPLVRTGEERMSALSIDNVWKEYGDQIVLEDVSIEIEVARLRRPRRPIRLRQDDVPAHASRPGTAKRAAPSCIDGTPLPREPGPDRGVVFQRYSVFPHLTVLGNVLIGKEMLASPLSGTAVWHGAKAGRRRGARA